MAKILIVDDHAVARAGCRHFLESEPSIQQVGEASCGNEVLGKLRDENWDLVILDLHMPDRSGLDVMNHITTQYPKVSILVMSGLPEEQYARNVLRAGARGYIAKGSDPEELVRAVQTVLRGRRYVSAALAEQMADDLGALRNQDMPVHSALSAREFQIFCKIASGSTVSKIAVELSLSAKTVSTYRSRILEKMVFKTNAELTVYALRQGLIR